jgi:serine/threonine protein kinase
VSEVDQSPRHGRAEPGEADSRRVGPYHLVRLLGRGTRGAVWLARHPDEEHDVALKIVSVPRGVVAAEIPTDFDAMQGLSHPSILRVLGGGTAEDPFHPGAQCLYYAMEAMPDGTLAEQLRRGPLDPIKAARLMREVCQAVAAAQRQGLLHLDIKPSNILLDRAVPKLADFSFLIPAIPPRPKAAARTLGTIGFLSPEQSLNRVSEINQRSDVYGICATLMALITGSGLGDDESTERVRLAQPELLAIIDKGLEREPEKRFRSAVALGLALDEFFGLAQESATSPVQKSSPPWVLMALALLALIGLFWRFGGTLRDTKESGSTGSSANIPSKSSADSAPPPTPNPTGSSSTSSSPSGSKQADSAHLANQTQASFDTLERQLNRRDYSAALQTLSAQPSGSRVTWTDQQHLNFVRAQIGAWLYDFSYHPHDLSLIDELFQSGSLAKDIARAIRTARAMTLLQAYPFELKVLQHLQDMHEPTDEQLQAAITKDLTLYPRATELLLTAAMLDLAEGRPDQTRRSLLQLSDAAQHPGRQLLQLLADLAIEGKAIPPSIFDGVTDRYPILNADLGLLHLLNADEPSLPQAITALDAATLASPNLASAHHHLAVAQQRSGDPMAALQTLNTLVQKANTSQSWDKAPTATLTPATRTSATYHAPNSNHLKNDPWLAALRQHPDWQSKVGQHLPD